MRRKPGCSIWISPVTTLVVDYRIVTCRCAKAINRTVEFDVAALRDVPGGVGQPCLFGQHYDACVVPSQAGSVLVQNRPGGSDARLPKSSRKRTLSSHTLRSSMPTG